MIWLPFDPCDPELEAFAKNNLFVPPDFMMDRVVKATPSNPVGKDESILVVAHGNGVAISNWMEEKKTPKESKYEELQPDNFAPKLAAILPKGYRGRITLWSCQAARPWRYVKGVREQLEKMKNVDVERALNQSFLTLLFDQLNVDGLKREQLLGPIGFITLNREFPKAAIYENEDQLQYGNEKPVKLGTSLVHAGQVLNSDYYTKFYKGYQEEDDSDYNSDTGMDVDNTSRRVFKSKGEYLDAIVENAPFGSSSQLRSLKEHLERQQNNKT
jgi:hypothetical protein